jgi:triacylglycerol lipase
MRAPHFAPFTDVLYLSYAGVRPIEEMPTILRPSTRLLSETTGENDSQVPLSSTKWGTFMGEVCADHNELVGWNFGIRCERSHRPFDHLEFYQRVLIDLSIRV